MRGSQNGPSGTYCSSTLTVRMSSSRWRTRAGLAHARSPSLPWPLRYGLQSRVTQRWRRPDSCFLGDEREWDSLEFESAITLPRLRSEEHTSELQSRLHLVCRLLLATK